MIANIVKWLVWIGVIIGVVLGAVAYTGLQSAKKEVSEFRKSGTAAAERLNSAETLANQVSQNHAKLATATANTLKTYGDGIEQNRKDIAETNENVSGLAERVTKLEEAMNETRTAAADASKKASDALAKVEGLGKEMQTAQNAQKNRSAKQRSGKSARTAAAQQPVPQTVPAAPAYVPPPPAPQPATVAPAYVPAPAGTAASTITPGARAVQQERVQREYLQPGVMSRRYSGSDIRAGKVVVTKRYGVVTVYNYVNGGWGRSGQAIPVTFQLNQGISSYTDADWVVLSSDQPLEIEKR